MLQRYLVEFSPDSLQDIRKGRKMTRRELARTSGVSEVYIGELERDEAKSPSLDIVRKLGLALGVFFI